jgi:DNA repair protein RadC
MRKESGLMPTVEKVEKIEATDPGNKKITPFPTRLEYHPTIHDLPSDERPRERLRHYGARALSNAELLAIILRTGTAQDNVIELASKLLAKYGGLSGLMRADFMELCAEHGLGEAKTAQIKAALEIGRRLSVAQPEEKYQIKSPADAAALVMLEMTLLLPS